MVIQNVKYVADKKDIKLLVFRRQFVKFQIIMLNWSDYNGMRLDRVFRGNNLDYQTQNVVLLIPMISEDRKSEFWQNINSRQFHMRYINCSVIFYQSKQSLTMTNTSRNPFEIYVLNYEAKNSFHNRYNWYSTSKIDVENSVFGNVEMNNESNLHDRMFGSISKKPNLIIHTLTATNKSVTKTSVQRGNATLNNLGNADYYLANFVARNLRVKEAVIQKSLEYQSFGKFDFRTNNIFNCSASRGREFYGELYNYAPYSPQHLLEQ